MLPTGLVASVKHTVFRAAGALLHRTVVPQVISQLTAVEKNLMSQKLYNLEHCLDPGLTRLNWNSLGIKEFIDSCTKSIHEFQSLMNQVQKNSAIIEKVVAGIATARLVAELPQGKSAWLNAASCPACPIGSRHLAAAACSTV